MFVGHLDASEGDVFDLIPMTGFYSTASFVGETFLKNHQLTGSGRRPFTKVLQQETRDECQQQNRNPKTDRRTEDAIKHAVFINRRSGSQRVE